MLQFFARAINISFSGSLKFNDSLCLGTISLVVAKPAWCSNVDQYLMLIHDAENKRFTDAGIVGSLKDFAAFVKRLVFVRIVKQRVLVTMK